MPSTRAADILLSEQKGDVRRHGMGKEGGIRRQFVLGLVQTTEGLPLHHEVHEGSVAEVRTLKGHSSG